MKQPALFRALEWLRLRLKKSERSQEKLPGVREMAAEAGVSLVTLWKAVQELQLEGLLHTRGRAGIFTGRAEPGPVRTTSPFLQLWQRTAERIEKEILAGKWPDSIPFPRATELARRSGCSPATMRKALRELERRGILALEGRPRVTALRSFRSRATLVLLTGTDTKQASLPRSPRFIEFRRHLESQCHAQGIRMRLFPIAPSGALPRPEEGEAWIGGILWHKDLENPRDTEIVQQFRALRLPLAIFVEGRPLPGLIPTRAERVRGFHFDNHLAGKIMGRHLLSEGQSQSDWLYLSPYGSQTWSRARLSGLQSLRQERIRVVENHALSQYSSWDLRKRLLEELGCDPNALKRRFGKPASPNGRFLLEELGFDFNDAITLWLEKSGIILLLQQALSLRPSAKTWICANDRVALTALAYLGRMNLKSTPHIVGFDDSPEAVRAGIISYSFDMPTAVNRGLYHILTPTSKTLGPSGWEALEGFVASRFKLG